MVHTTALNRKGYSLIELVCTVAVLAILAAAAIPKNPADDSGALEYYAMQIVSDLRWMQQVAADEIRGRKDIPQVRPDSVYYFRTFHGGYAIVKNNRTVKQVDFPSGMQAFLKRDLYFTFHGVTTAPISISLSYQRDYCTIRIDSVGRIRIQKK